MQNHIFIHNDDENINEITRFNEAIIKSFLQWVSPYFMKIIECITTTIIVLVCVYKFNIMGKWVVNTWHLLTMKEQWIEISFMILMIVFLSYLFYIIYNLLEDLDKNLMNKNKEFNELLKKYKELQIENNEYKYILSSIARTHAVELKKYK